LSTAFKGPIEAYTLLDGIFEKHTLLTSAGRETSGSHYNHRGIQYIPVAKIVAFLGPDKTEAFEKVSGD